jgi:lipopolysaccharide/colanic/teichoic acid biosynthesis glycosyltransferase
VKFCPVFVDHRPGYLSAPGHSLLLAPLGRTTVFERLRSEVSRYTRSRVVVTSRFTPDAAYLANLGVLGVRPEEVVSADRVAEHLKGYEPSDWLLICDSRWASVEPMDLTALVSGSPSSPRTSRHLVIPATTPAGTREIVVLDAAGQVARVQRYYESVTWPMASGVACSLVPLACRVALPEFPVTELSELRSALAAAGAASQDSLLRTPAFDLATEAGLITATEGVLQSLAGSALARPPSVSVDPGACIRGTVWFGRGVVVESGATIIGPSVLGDHARVGSEAVLAHCVVTAGTQVPPGMTASQSVLTPGSETPRGTRDEPPGDEASVVAAPARDNGPELDPLGWKRPVELVLSFVALVLLSPLLALIALLIKLDSRGPVLFGDEREGYRGRPFRCWKLRTMFEGAEAAQRALAAANQLDGPQFKIVHDPRITRVGRFLRGYNLDELPQLLNVLAGEMSLVGPRPSPFRENQLCIPWREARLSVPPGITGLWQICRRDRSTGDFHQWIHYDLLYVNHASPRLDLMILLATVWSLATGRSVPLSRLLRPEEFYERRQSPNTAAVPGSRRLRRTGDPPPTGADSPAGQ